ncbi:MAG TPA: carboxypeptidase regulatory-like domain-containing protein [Candidatus Acidoferrales bacterium]|nr:carboxypeptidase regulatory-like domain-containing protein [Candidatus Acidoferrales bacterium]
MATRMRVLLSAGALVAAGLLFWVSSGKAQSKDAPTAEISGTVTANRDYALSEASGNHIPSLVAVRVRARDEERRITYTVFTQKGHYQIYNLPPGTYKMSALQDGFDSNGPTVEIKSGEKKTADVALVVRPDHLRSELVDFDTLFPPGPTRDYLMQNCMGCHGFEHIPWQRMGGGVGRTPEVWGAAVSRMFNMDGTSPVNHTGVPQVNPAAIPEAKREEIAAYFSKIFPAGMKRRDFKLDDLKLDEAALSRAIYIEYDLPPVKEGPKSEYSEHDVWPSKISNSVYVAQMGTDSVQAMDRSRIDYPGRFQTFVLPNPDEGHRVLGPHGITQAKDGHVYTADIDESGVTELDPETGKAIYYATPTRSTPHTIRSDSKGNVWFTEMQGVSKVGKLDAVTKKITEWDPSPTDTNAHYYGMTVDQKDRVWAVGMTSHKIVGYDPKTDKWSVYATPTQPSGPRRPTVDSKGKVWFSEHIGQALGVLDPDTGKITEYKDPFKLGGGYECYADSHDNIWVTLRSYGVLARFDQKTKTYTYFPEPFPDIMGRENPGPNGTRLGGLYPPKIEEDGKGTFWYSGIRMTTLTAFKPEGNVPNNSMAAAK